MIEATTGEEALMCFIDLNHQIDLLIADMALPTMPGLEVALLMRSKIPHLPVVLTSAHPVKGWNNQDYGDLERLGSQVAFLRKPFQAQELLKAMFELLGLSLGNETARTA